MKYRKTILKEAGILLIVVILIFSSVTAMATTSEKTLLIKTDIKMDNPKTNIGYLPSGNVLWDNWVEDFSGAFAAQQEPPGVPNPLDAFPADDFMFDEDTEVYRVYWGGGYWQCNNVQGPKDYHWDWNVTFFEDDGSGYHPGDIYAGPYTISDADIIKSVPVLNSTTESNGIWGCGCFAWLPDSVTFNADNKYWITIYALGEIFPQSGWAQHTESFGGILLHEANFKSDYFGIPDWTNTSEQFGEPYDMLYALLGPEPDFEVTISKGLGVTATIKNQGVLDAANVTATITTTGGFVLGGVKTVNIGDIAIGDTGTAKTFLIGIGSIAVDVQVTCDQGMTGNGNTDGFLLFFFII